jgi:hypothetical protein
MGHNGADDHHDTVHEMTHHLADIDRLMESQ